MQTLNVLNFIGLNLAIALTSFIIVAKLNTGKTLSIIKWTLSIFVVFCSLIIVFEELLGSFGLLFYKQLTISIYTLSLLIFFAFGPAVLKTLKIEKSNHDKPNFLGVLLLFGPILTLLGMKAFNAALQVPLEYDSVAYHLPFVAEWFQTGTLSHLYYNAFAGPISYYPSNYELLDLWTVILLKNDFLANVLNFLIFPFFGLALWRILRNLGVGKNIALMGTAAPFYMPIFLHQAGLPLVDLFFVTVFAIALLFTLEIANQKKYETNYSDFVLCGLSIGLFMGTKYLGLVYGAILILLLVGLALYKSKKTNLNFFKAGYITFLSVVLTGAFFYIRNWINAGNPLFPVDLSVFGMTFFSGYKGANVQEFLKTTSLLVAFKDLDNIKAFLRSFFYMTGPYGLLSVLWSSLLVLLYGPLLLRKILKKKASWSEFSAPVVLVLGTLVYFYLYIKAPYTQRDLLPNIRYSMPFLFIGIINIAYFASQRKLLKFSFLILSPFIFLFSFYLLILHPPESIPSTGRFLLDLSLFNEYKTHVLWLTLGALSALTSIVVFFLSNTRKRLMTSSVFLAFSLILITRFFHFASLEREVLRNHSAEVWFQDENEEKILDIFRAAEWLNTYAPHSRIAYTGFNYHYQLFGRDFSREVDYVNINDCTNCRYLEYKDAEDSIRRDPNYENWYENLKVKDKEYLVVNPVITEEVYNYEFEWANTNPDHFEEVFNLNNIYIYKINYD